MKENIHFESISSIIIITFMYNMVIQVVICKIFFFLHLFNSVYISVSLVKNQKVFKLCSNVSGILHKDIPQNCGCCWTIGFKPPVAKSDNSEPVSKALFLHKTQ